MFDDILGKKKAFLDFKIRKLKKYKNQHFSKGLLHGFGKKMELFHPFIFGNKNSQQNVFDNILERKKVFLTLKSES